MALWKLFRGNRENLTSVEKHDGYVYFCDDGSLHFDYTGDDGALQRKQVNSDAADWAKIGMDKPAYTAEEVGALPEDTFIPSSTKDITNDSGFITSTTNELVHYYTLDQVDNRFTTKEAFEAHCSTALARKVLTAGQYVKDEEGRVRLTLTDNEGNPVNPVNGTIYLIPGTYGANNIFEEYLYFNMSLDDTPAYALELIGTTEAHFDDYYTKDETYKVVTDAQDNPVMNLLEVVYPIGSIYLTVLENANPRNIFGFGVWEQIKDRFLLGAGDTYTAGATGGNASYKIKEKNLPYLGGYVQFHGASGNLSGTVVNAVGTLANSASNTFVEGVGHIAGYYHQGNHTNNATAQSWAGFNISLGQIDNDPVSTLPPYLSVYMWKRVG